MQKFFSAFPTGSPGLGLLLLRVFIALTVIAQSATYGWLFVVLFFAGAICLLIGFLTPIAAAIIGLAAITYAILFDGSYIVLVEIILAASIALLGPGAFSVDARLFGRREIRIP